MPERRPRILLADDDPMILVGLGKLLEPEIEVVATVTDGGELLTAAERLRPDLVISDVEMPGLDGIEATRRLQAAFPDVKVLIVSIHTEPSSVRAAFAAGARGYLPKSSVFEEFARAVHEVLADRFYISPAVARAVVEALSLPEPAGEALTPREEEILHLMTEGLSNQQIARRLGVAVTTVRTHLSSLYKKLRLESRVELALYAAQAGGAAPARSQRVS
jgi:DNA-binding NarL/FixJ family response regulator